MKILYKIHLSKGDNFDDQYTQLYNAYTIFYKVTSAFHRKYGSVYISKYNKYFEIQKGMANLITENKLNIIFKKMLHVSFSRYIYENIINPLREYINFYIEILKEAIIKYNSDLSNNLIERSIISLIQLKINTINSLMPI